MSRKNGARGASSAPAKATWDGGNMTQEEMMLKDECIVVDNDDKIIGHASKKDTHVFSTKQPRGVLHRAFSVFLFDRDGKLLLQQRAADKITFPNVWTNTCCSHPLYGYSPSEADNEAALADGSVPGVKAAAVRKLAHELGIAAKDVPISKFKFLTRLHYWAADVVTHGPKAPWGEHEIDYILFIQADVKMKPNPEEVTSPCLSLFPSLPAHRDSCPHSPPPLLHTAGLRRQVRDAPRVAENDAARVGVAVEPVVPHHRGEVPRALVEGLEGAHITLHCIVRFSHAPLSSAACLTLPTAPTATTFVCVVSAR